MITLQYNNDDPLKIDESKIDPNHFITIRTTALEQFLQCWYKYFNNKEIFTKYSIFHIGKQLHKYLQARMLGKDAAAEKILDEVSTIEENNFIRKSGNVLEKYDALNWTNYWKIDMNEMSYWLYIEYDAIKAMWDKDLSKIEWIWDGKYLIYLEWTLDGVRYNDDWTVSIIDLKSASSMWKQDDMNEKLQKIVYPWLYRNYNPNDVIRDFTYIVFDKKTNPSVKMFEYKPNKDEVNKIVMKDINTYMRAKILKEYTTHRTWKCRWCSLSKNKTCPEFMEI